MLGRLAVDLVLDVGANEGQFAKSLRADMRYAGPIVSFEPAGPAYGVPYFALSAASTACRSAVDSTVGWISTVAITAGTPAVLM